MSEKSLIDQVRELENELTQDAQRSPLMVRALMLIIVNKVSRVLLAMAQRIEDK